MDRTKKHKVTTRFYQATVKNFVRLRVQRIISVPALVTMSEVQHVLSPRALILRKLLFVVIVHFTPKFAQIKSNFKTSVKKHLNVF